MNPGQACLYETKCQTLKNGPSIWQFHLYLTNDVLKTPWEADSRAMGRAHQHINRILILFLGRKFGSSWYLPLVLPTYSLSFLKILSFLSSPCLQYSLCNEPLIELSNPGASGSVFYVTKDDEFIIKTVMHKEAEFLQKLLPGYYMVSVCVCGAPVCVEHQCGRWMRSKLWADGSCWFFGESREKCHSFLHIYSNEK